MDTFRQRLLEQFENHFDEQDDLCEAVKQDDPEINVNKLKTEMSRSIRLGHGVYKLNQKWKTPKYNQLKTNRHTDVEEIGAVMQFVDDKFVIESDDGNEEEGDTAAQVLVKWINAYKDVEGFVKGSIQLKYKPTDDRRWLDDIDQETGIDLAFLSIKYLFDM